MKNQEELLDLQQEKLRLFLEYEEATTALLDCDADAAENYITTRSELANRIDEHTEKIGRLCDAEPGGDLLLNVVLARCNYDQVPPEYRDLYRFGQDMRSAVNRIQQADVRVVQRLGQLRADAEAHIRDNQHLPKIKKYLSDLGDGSTGNSLTDKKA